MTAAYYDLWAWVQRPPLWCKGCGYFRPVQGRHRADCTHPAVVQERRRAVIRERLAQIDQWRAELEAAE